MGVHKQTRGADSDPMIRRALFCSLLAVAGACSTSSEPPSRSMPKTNIPRWDQTEEYRAQRAAQRDRDICMNPLRRCADLSPEEWDLLRAEWDSTHP